MARRKYSTRVCKHIFEKKLKLDQTLNVSIFTLNSRIQSTLSTSFQIARQLKDFTINRSDEDRKKSILGF